MIPEYPQPKEKEYENKRYVSEHVVKDGEEGEIIEIDGSFLREVHESLASVSDGGIGWEDAQDFILGAVVKLLVQKQFKYYVYTREPNKKEKKLVATMELTRKENH